MNPGRSTASGGGKGGHGGTHGPQRDAANPATFDDLTAAVAEQGTVIQSAVVLMDDLGNRLLQHADNPQRIREIGQSLIAQKQTLADAVQRNTPADPNNPPPGPAGGRR